MNKRLTLSDLYNLMDNMLILLHQLKVIDVETYENTYADYNDLKIYAKHMNIGIIGLT